MVTFNITGIPYYEPISLGMKAAIIVLLSVRIFQEDRRFKAERTKR